jgi:two-component system, sensor histidine kinase
VDADEAAKLPSMDEALEIRSRATSLADREAALQRREQAAWEREDSHRLVEKAMAELAVHNEDLLQANQKLVMATLAAQELREAAQMARRRQDEFLAMLAHELRNPLAPISSAVEVLARLDGKPVPLKLLEIVRRQIKHLVRLVDDLLDVSRMTERKVLLQRQTTAVAAFIQQAIDTCHDDIEGRHHRLSVHIDAGPLFVDGDPFRLTQIVTNLLQNATKYTPDRGHICVSARQQGDRVEIRISDDGAGITAEALPHVFDLFVQDERPLSRAQGGLGIGLTVVQRMVEMHGGTVEARSDGRDRGSEFTVWLPVIDAPGALKVAPRAVAAVASVPARILIVEDNVDAGNMLADLLRLSGHEVEIALDGPSGLQRFENWSPQVVLCDIGLPGLDGYEVVAQMRSSRHDPRPALIALSGYGGPADVERALLAGFDHHVVKPASPVAILQLIDSSMRPNNSTLGTAG